MPSWAAAIQRKMLEDIEENLTALPAAEWATLCAKVAPHFAQRDGVRGWQQAFDRLNEAKGYRFIARCGGVPSFIREGADPTPDIELNSPTGLVVCEVKTINRSDMEIVSVGSARSTLRTLPEEFIQGKLQNTVDHARKQLETWRASEAARRVLYLVVNFDDSFAQYAEDYNRQMQASLTSMLADGFEIVYHAKPSYYSASTDRDLNPLEAHLIRQ